MLMRKMDCTQLLIPPAPTEENAMKLVSVVTQLPTLVSPDHQAALINDLFIPEYLKEIVSMNWRHKIVYSKKVIRW